MFVKRLLTISFSLFSLSVLTTTLGVSAASAERLGGQDRYETAALVAQKVHEEGLAGSTVLLTTGENYPDAVSAGAWKEEAAILLTRRDSLPLVTKNFLGASWITKVYAIGGEAVISDAVLDEVRGLGLEVERVAGLDRYATSVAVSKASLQAGSASSIWIASGTLFTDQLSAAAAARQSGGAFLLASPGRPLSSSQVFEIQRVRSSINTPIYLVDSAVTLGEVAVSGMSTSRVSGTAYGISNSTQASATSIVIASGENWPDALGGTRLVTPTRTLVLSKKSCVPSEVSSRVSRATSTTILGGTAALSSAIEAKTACPSSASFEAPIVTSGSGDKYIDYAIPYDSPAVLEIRHKGESNFSIVSYNGASGYIDLLVNEIGDYSGRILVYNEMDSYQDERVRHLEISADGEWEIVAIPVAYLRTFSSSANGSGDDVVQVKTTADRITLSHDGDSNFIVIARGSFRYGSTWDLLVNEIGRYSGQVRLESGATVFSIQADGNWTILAG
jgi:hypothetical protein